MKFGFNFLLWTTFVTEEHTPLFELLKSIGYDGIEIPAGDGPVAHYTELAPRIRDHGLEVTTVAMGLPDADPSSPDPKIRRAGLDRLRSRIECAHEAGSSILGGPLYAAHKHFVDEPLTDDNYWWAGDVLAEAAVDAEEAGVTMCLEVLNRFEIALANTTAQARRICEVADHPRVRIHYDTHHGHLEENSHAVAFASAGPYLAHVHISESHRGVLGTGLVDWAAVGQALKNSGYDGWCTVEAFSTKVDGIRQAANVHRDSFESRESLARDAFPFLQSLT